MSATLDLRPAGASKDEITPREYQEEAINAVLTKWEEGVRRQLGVAATGLGKTVIFTELARRMNVRTLILAHRDELIQQAVDKLSIVWHDAPVGVVKAQRDEHAMPVVVASVQTLARQARLDRITDPFGLVIVDEAHHAVADSYKRVLKYFGCGPEAPEVHPLLLGVTATPDRGDKAGLAPIFDEIVFRYDMRWGISNDYLSDIRAKQVMLEMDLDTVKSTHGDWQDGALGEAMIEANAPQHVFEAWKDHASERKTLVFTPTVATADAVASVFRAGGVSAAFVSGMTPMDERRQILKDFSEGTIQVLANCAVLTEGYDEPSVDCIVMARPTQSRPFYQQMVGRGTRKYPQKTDCLILDVVGVAKRHSLATASSLLGAEPKDLEKGASIKQIMAAEQARAEAAAAGRLVDEDIDLWAQFEDAQYSWVKTAKGFALSMPDGVTMNLWKVTADGWGAIITRQDGNRTILSSTKAGVPVEMAQGIAEDWARTKTDGDRRSVALVRRDAAWRQRPATDKQRAALKKWRIPWQEGMTAGQASDLLTSKAASSPRKTGAAPRR